MRPLLTRVILYGHRFWARLRRIFWFNLLIDAYVRFNRDNGWLLSAGLSFYLILAFIPLLLVGLWGLGHVYANHPDTALQEIQNRILPQIVPGGGASSEVKHLMIRAGIASSPNGKHAGPALIRLLNGHGVAGILALVTTIWAALQIFVNGSTAMNAAWEMKEKRNWFLLRGIALCLLIFTGILLAVSLLTTGVATHLADSRYGHFVPFESVLFVIAAEIAAIIVSALMYSAIFRFLPGAAVSWKAAVAGAMFSAITWEIAKKALAVFLLRPNQNLYGDLGNLIVFVLWILYSMVILLLGAEVSAVYARNVENWHTTSLRATAAPDPPYKTSETRRRRRRSVHGGGPHTRH